MHDITISITNPMLLLAEDLQQFVITRIKLGIVSHVFELSNTG